MSDEYTRHYTVGSAAGDLSYATVDKLKTIIRAFNVAPLYGGLRLSGRKDELYTRLRDYLTHLDRTDPERFREARDEVRKIVTGQTHPPGVPPAGASATTSAAAPSTSYGNGYDWAGVSGSSFSRPGYGSTNSGYGLSSNLYSSSVNSNALPPPRFQPSFNGGSGSNGASSSYGAQQAASQTMPIRFRPNPLFRIEKAVSQVTLLPSAGQGDRKSITLDFMLNDEQRALVTAARQSPSNPQWQLRLYCTNETFYHPQRGPTNQLPAPIDFPTTCEVKLNHFNVGANTKGIRNQVGTAPPANLSKSDRLQLGAHVSNRIEMIYVNTEKLPSKRYYMVVYLVEMTPIKRLVEDVKKNGKRPSQSAISMIVSQNADPEMRSSYTVPIKDPLTLARIKVPVRSPTCMHVACFDLEVWLSLNEQTPTWTCPICSKVLRYDELQHDGYVQDILDACDGEVDAVTIEPDGTWRSDNDKFGTAPAKAKPSTANNSNGASRTSSIKPEPEANGGGLEKQNGSTAEALTLDDSDDDDGGERAAKRPRLENRTSSFGEGGSGGSGRSSPIGANRTNGGGGGVPSGRRMETIDLTFSDSDDDGAEQRIPPVRLNATSLGTRKDSGGNSSYSNGNSGSYNDVGYDW
ncbi:hypothetical protein ACM66B_007109 [Microbotryomycetes sp. NB124-2]